jgi:hypothetical protein
VEIVAFNPWTSARTEVEGAGRRKWSTVSAVWMGTINTNVLSLLWASGRKLSRAPLKAPMVQVPTETPRVLLGGADKLSSPQWLCPFEMSGKRQQ